MYLYLLKIRWWDYIMWLRSPIVSCVEVVQRACNIFLPLAWILYSLNPYIPWFYMHFYQSRQIFTRATLNFPWICVWIFMSCVTHVEWSHLPGWATNTLVICSSASYSIVHNIWHGKMSSTCMEWRTGLSSIENEV